MTWVRTRPPRPPIQSAMGMGCALPSRTHLSWAGGSASGDRRCPGRRGTGLCATVPWEVRMSPQLHSSMYGFRPFRFDQAYRWGGYRPSVFMQHGIALGLFMASCTLVAFWLWRSGFPKRIGTPAAGVGDSLPAVGSPPGCASRRARSSFSPSGLPCSRAPARFGPRR